MQGHASTSKESIGWLVWAPLLPEHATIRWPSEALDPLHPPQGRNIPAEAYNGLSMQDRDALKHALQQLSRAAHATGASLQGNEDQQLAEALAASAAEALERRDCGGEGDDERTAAAASSGVNAEGKAGTSNSAARRMQPARAATPPKVLVNLFGTHKLLWMDRCQLLDFDEHRECAARPTSPQHHLQRP